MAGEAKCEAIFRQLMLQNNIYGIMALKAFRHIFLWRVVCGVEISDPFPFAVKEKRHL